MMLRLWVFLLIWPGLALAQPFPALYDVSGVAANDVLNIRMEPVNGTEIIGALAPDATDVEVVRASDDGKWGLVNTGDLAGWVAMRYLVRRPGQEWGVMPSSFVCSGTEPFWSFDVGNEDSASFTTLDGEDVYSVNARIAGVSFPGDFAIVAEGPVGRATAIVTLGFCNDGMSNREFGYSVGLLREGPASTVLNIGCCSLAR